MNSNIELLNRIQAIKEFIPTLTGETKKAIIKNNEMIDKLIIEVTNYRNILINILLRREESLKPHRSNNVAEMEEQLTKLLELDNVVKRSENYMEGNGFNQGLDTIYNPTNLYTVNKTIKEMIEKFTVAGITLTEQNFRYTEAVEEYMTDYFQNKDSDNYFQIMKTTFDRIYWANHEVLQDLALNFEHLIQKYDKQFVTFFTNAETEALKSANLDRKTLKKKIEEIKMAIDALKATDQQKCYETFTSGSENIDDYVENSEKYKTSIGLLIDEETYGNYDEEAINTFHKNVVDLNRNLEEYFKYQTFEFLTKKILDTYGKKDSLKGEYETHVKTLATLNQQKVKLDKTLDGLKKKLQKLNPAKDAKKYAATTQGIAIQKALIDQKLIEIRTEHDEYEKAKFNDDIIKKLNDSSTIYDALSIYDNHSVELQREISEKFKKLDPTERIQKLNIFNELMDSPYTEIIDSIPFLTKETVKDIIQNKYLLYGFKFKLGKHDGAEYQELKDSTTFINKYINLRQSHISPERVKLVLEIVNIKNEVIEQQKQS